MKQKLWCCVGYDFKEPVYDYESLAYYKKRSITKHLREGYWDWKTWQKKGWKCIRVEVTIKPI